MVYDYLFVVGSLYYVVFYHLNHLFLSLACDNDRLHVEKI